MSFNQQNSQQPIIELSQAQTDVLNINKYYEPCNLSFTVDLFQSVNPGDYSLNFSPATFLEMNQERKYFNSTSDFLIIFTGSWNRSSDLSSPAVGWTNLPSAGIYGSIIDPAAKSYPSLISHELGHYLGLSHVDDKLNIMNPSVYPNSTFYPSQCDLMKETIKSVWPAMLR